MGADHYDEAFQDSGDPRPHYRAALDALREHDLTDLGRLRGGVVATWTAL